MTSPPNVFEGLARSGLAAVFENFGDGTATITSKSGWKWSDIIHDVGMRYADWAHQDFAVRVENIGDSPNIVRRLVKHGYSDDEIAKAIGGNTLRVLGQAWSGSPWPYGDPRPYRLEPAWEYDRLVGSRWRGTWV